MFHRVPPGRFLACIAVALSLVVVACDNDDDDDSGGSDLSISMTFDEPMGMDDVVWMSQLGQGAGLLVVEVLAEDISSTFDGYDVEISFDPLIVEALSLAHGTLLDACSALQPFKVDNVANGNANASGTILFSAVLPGAAPPGCTLAGRSTLARITLRARNRGMFPMDFIPFNGDPNNPSGSRFFRTQPAIPSVPVSFFTMGNVVIEVTR